MTAEEKSPVQVPLMLVDDDMEVIDEVMVVMDETNHKQVPFKTLDGEVVGVDEGVRPVLEQLRRLGVRTQFSCQGDMFAAYVLADRKSFFPVLRLIRKKYQRRAYSPLARDAAWGFLRGGFTQHSFVRYRVVDKPYGRVHTILWNVKYERGLSDRQSYSIEYDYDNIYGFRICMRWPKQDMHKVLRLLMET